jgi:hypothetical protein
MLAEAGIAGAPDSTPDGGEDGRRSGFVSSALNR